MMLLKCKTEGRYFNAENVLVFVEVEDKGDRGIIAFLDDGKRLRSGILQEKDFDKLCRLPNFIQGIDHEDNRCLFNAAKIHEIIQSEEETGIFFSGRKKRFCLCIKRPSAYNLAFLYSGQSAVR